MSNDELQKAIDDITSGGNGATGVISSGDGTASVPEMSDTEMLSAMDEPTPSDNVMGDNIAPAVAPSIDTTNVGDFSLPMPPTAEVATPSGEAQSPDATNSEQGGLGMPDIKLNIPDAPSPSPVQTPVEMPVAMQPEVASAMPNGAGATPQAVPEVKMPELSQDGPKDPELKEVEMAALLELYPLLEKMNVNAREKFDICMKVIEKTGEKGASTAALKAAKDITDEKEKGECLVKLVEAIDKM